MVHAGFYHVFTTMRQDIADFIGEQSKVSTIHCIGHSLGGAVANLAAEWIFDTYSAKIKLYTFGAPRVGVVTGFPTAITKKLGGENIHRVFHNSDPVPMVPTFPYFHASTSNHSYYIQYNSSAISFGAHKMLNYIDSVKSKEWPALLRPEPNLSFNSIKQWLKQDSHENMQDSIFWSKLNAALAYVVQVVLASVQWSIMGGLTIADYLAMILKKGIGMVGDIGNWIFALVRKLMKMLGMKVAEKVEDLTEQLLSLVLSRVTSKIYREARQALDRIR